MTEISTLQAFRIKYKPELPRSLRKGIKRVAVVEGDKTDSITHQQELKALFPNTYGQSVITFKAGKKPKKLEAKNFGVILSGGQAPGGHNVITGLYDALKKINRNNKLFGFLGGPSGIVDGKYIELDDALINSYRNTGGFDMIGSGRTKLETEAPTRPAWVGGKTAIPSISPRCSTRHRGLASTSTSRARSWIWLNAKLTNFRAYLI